MKVSGFTIIRNGVKFDYPFIESINSILPVCDEFIVVAGNSEDDTREKIVAIGSGKIKIIDTVWDENLRTGGKILAQQTDIALDAISGDWGFYLQADEVAHENDLPLIRDEMQKNLHNPQIEGLLFNYFHFWGYRHLWATRRAYRREIRIVRNDKRIRAYRDAQGFRMYPSLNTRPSHHHGEKLNVKLIGASIFAYSRVREPQLELEKNKSFDRWWHDDGYIRNKYRQAETFDYSNIERVIPFTGTHPATMQERIKNSKWNFEPGRLKFSFKESLLSGVEKITGWRPGEYRNYRIVAR